MPSAPVPSPALPSPAVPSPALPATPEAFDALYAAVSPRLTWQTYLLTSSRHRAAHCVRRSFQLAWTNWPTVSADTSPEGWLRAEAFDLALSPWHGPGERMRRAFQLAHRHSRRASGTDDTTELSLGEQDRVLMRSMMRLPRPQRRAVVLHDVVGLDWAQTAAEVEGSTPVTFGRVARARRALAESVPGVIGADDPEAPGFGRRLGERLRSAALRACALSGSSSAGTSSAATSSARTWTGTGTEGTWTGTEGAGTTGHAAPARVTRARARLHDGGLTLAAGALTLATAGLLGAGLVWGTPLHPMDRPVVPHPSHVTITGTAGTASTIDIQPPRIPAPPLTPFTTGPGLIKKDPNSSGDARKPSRPKAAKNAGQPAGSSATPGPGSGGTGAHPQHDHPHQPPPRKHH